jgi:hypothetical protein
VTKEDLECPHAGNICRLDSTHNFFATAFNNLCGAVLAPALPIQDVKSNRNACCWDVSVLGRRYVRHSHVHS